MENLKVTSSPRRRATTAKIDHSRHGIKYRHKEAVRRQSDLEAKQRKQGFKASCNGVCHMTSESPKQQSTGMDDKPSGSRVITDATLLLRRLSQRKSTACLPRHLRCFWEHKQAVTGVLSRSAHIHKFESDEKYKDLATYLHCTFLSELAPRRHVLFKAFCATSKIIIIGLSAIGAVHEKHLLHDLKLARNKSIKNNAGTFRMSFSCKRCTNVLEEGKQTYNAFWTNGSTIKCATCFSSAGLVCFHGSKGDGLVYIV